MRGTDREIKSVSATQEIPSASGDMLAHHLGIEFSFGGCLAWLVGIIQGGVRQLVRTQGGSHMTLTQLESFIFFKSQHEPDKPLI